MPGGHRPLIAWPTVVVGAKTVYHLSEPDLDDAEHLHAMFSDPAITRHIPAPPSSAAAWRTLISRTGVESETGQAEFAVLTQGSDREAAGLVQIAPVPDGSTAWMWSVVVAERFWGTGLFGVVADAVLSVASSQLRATELKAWIAADNAGPSTRSESYRASN